MRPKRKKENKRVCQEVYSKIEVGIHKVEENGYFLHATKIFFILHVG